MSHLRQAVFLDRDGVLVDDQGFLLRAEQIRLLEGVPAALRELKAAGMFLAVVSNQAAVARGLLAENDLQELNRLILDQIQAAAARGWMPSTTAPTTPRPRGPNIAAPAPAASRGRACSSRPPPSMGSICKLASW